jgi:hypothetical protein
MGGRNGSNGTSRSRTLQVKIDNLEGETLRLAEQALELAKANEDLESKVERLTKVNSLQVSRLCGEELLRVRIKELEAQLKKDGA